MNLTKEQYKAIVAVFTGGALGVPWASIQRLPPTKNFRQRDRYNNDSLNFHYIDAYDSEENIVEFLIGKEWSLTAVCEESLFDETTLSFSFKGNKDKAMEDLIHALLLANHNLS